MEEAKKNYIPELPLVDGLEFTFIENWGCEDFISLNGIEIFDDKGKKVKIDQKDISLKLKDKLNTRHSEMSRLFNS